MTADAPTPAPVSTVEEQVAEVLAELRCRDVHGAGWPGGELENMLGPAPISLPCASCRSWATYAAPRFTPLIADLNGAAAAEALREAASEVNFDVARSAVIVTRPTCHKKGCQCFYALGRDDDELVALLAKRFRDALRDRADAVAREGAEVGHG